MIAEVSAPFEMVRHQTSDRLFLEKSALPDRLWLSFCPNTLARHANKAPLFCNQTACPIFLTGATKGRRSGSIQDTRACSLPNLSGEKCKDSRSFLFKSGNRKIHSWKETSEGSCATAAATRRTQATVAV